MAVERKVTNDQLFCGAIELGAEIENPPLKFVILLILGGHAGDRRCGSGRSRILGLLACRRAVARLAVLGALWTPRPALLRLAVALVGRGRRRMMDKRILPGPRP